MKKSVLMFLFASVATSSSHAQFMRAEGAFASESVELKTLLLDPEKGVVAASATVNEGACSGSIAGVGKMNGKVLSIEPYVKIEGGEQCVLQVSFDAKWSRAKISEGKGCAPYHGAACSWEGQEVKRKAQ